MYGHNTSSPSMLDRIPDDPIRLWELNGNHSRWERSQAYPSDHTLHVMFAVLATINAIVATVCLILILSILRYRKIRNNPFNLYLLFIATPDFISSFLCFLTCAMSAPKSAFYSEMMCSFQAFYLVFGFTANCWMNGIITYEIHRMLRLSHRRARHEPPSRKRVLLQTSAVYAYALFWSCISVWHIPGLPHESHLLYGIACFPQEYNRPSAYFFWLVFFPCFLGLPVLYVSYVVVDVWRRNLMPPEGRRRNLTLYFARLVFVYHIMWVPTFAICYIGNFVDLSSWVYWTGAAWSHLQGLVSALVATTRPQIHKAVLEFLRCVSDQQEEEEASSRSTRRRTSIMDSFVFQWSSRMIQTSNSRDLARSTGHSSSNQRPVRTLSGDVSAILGACEDGEELHLSSCELDILAGDHGLKEEMTKKSTKRVSFAVPMSDVDEEQEEVERRSQVESCSSSDDATEDKNDDSPDASP